MNNESRANAAALAGQHVAIVGASSGVGYALAQSAAGEGARLTLFGRDLAKLRSVFHHLPAADLRCLDIGDTARIEPALQGIDSVDHLIVTAGTLAFAPFVETNVDQWRDIMEERVIGPLTLIKALAPRIRRSIVLFSGGIARRPVVGCAVLAAAVAAVESLGRALSLELAPVRVNVVAPGTLDTPMVEKHLGAQKQQAFSHIAASNPARRIGSAEDAAHAALFFMLNPYTTAATLDVDGGAKLV